MKIFLFSLLLLMGTQCLQAQDYHLYWKYKDYDGAIPVTAPGWLIEAGSWFVPEKAHRKIMRHVNKVRVLAFEGQSPITDRDRRKFEKRAARRHLEDLMVVRDGKTHVRILARDRGVVLRKLVVFVQSPETFALVTVKGRLRLDDINTVLQEASKKSKGTPKNIIPEIIDVPVKRI